eukprot:m.640606 g.640606  ORF g.640606 m.640606 type:complete len:113 (-) comp58343_c0_seq18:413-751(-)
MKDAERCFQECVEVSRELGDDSRDRLAKSLDLLASALFYDGQYDAASQACAEAVHVATAISDPYLCVYLSNASVIISSLGTPASHQLAVTLIAKVIFQLLVFQLLCSSPGCA